MKTRNWTAALRKAFATSAATAGIVMLFAATAGTACAQDGPPPPGGGQGGPGGFGMRGMMGGPRMGLPHSMQLVNRPDVSRDLALTQDQHDQIRDVLDRAREKMGPPPGGGPGGPGGPDGFGPPPGGPPGGGQGGPGGPGGFGGPGGNPEMRAKMDKMQAEIDKSIDKVLSSSQATRLKEIKFQLAGASAALDKDVQSQIGITADQKTQIDAAVKAQREKMGPPGGGPGGPGGPDGFGPPPGGPPGGGQGGPGGPPPGGGPGGPGGFGGPGMDRAHSELNTAIDAILTSDQKSALKKLAGTKVFVEDKRPMRRGPGGFGAPPPGGGDDRQGDDN